jgi:hypothetical protein
LGIASPSRVFASLGEYTVEGFNKGIKALSGTTSGIVDDWIDTFDNVQADIGLNITTNADETMQKLQGLKANYGTDFATDAVVNTVRKVSMQTSGTTTLNANDGLKEALKEAIKDELTPVMNKVADNTQAIAEKDFSSGDIYIGNKKVASAVEEQKKANGYSFTPATA